MLLWVSKHIIYSSLAQVYWTHDSISNVVSKHRTNIRSWYSQRHSFLLCLPPFYRCINPRTVQSEGNTKNRTLIRRWVNQPSFPLCIPCFILSQCFVPSKLASIPTRIFFPNNSCILSIHLIHIFSPTFILFYVCDIYKRDSYKKWKRKYFISLNLFPIRVQYVSYEICSSIHEAFNWSKST